MAYSSKARYHSRSLSLPSESHPSTSQFDENLSRIKASGSTSISSLSSMNDKLNTLQKLYVSIDDLPHIGQIISQDSHEKWVDQVLDGLIRLLDACSSVKDLISVTKQDVQELLSSLRRKNVHGIRSHLISRRSKKMIEKSLKNLKNYRGKYNVDCESISIPYMLKEAQSATFSIFESLLTYMMGTMGQTSWSLISKLIHTKKVDGATKINEFDSILQMIQEDDVSVEDLMEHLKNMDSNMQILEENVECLFRQLIKTRVFLLNIINH